MEPTLDPQVWLHRRFASHHPEMAWRKGSPEAMQAWQATARARFATLLGGQPSLRPVMAARIEETRRMRGYRRESVVFESRPGLLAFGYFLVPDDCASGSPAMLCLPGHGRGVDSIVGIAEDGTQRELGEPDEYQADFALQCVAQGYPTFALEQVSFGHRRDAKAQAAGGGASSCTRDAMAALMLGETLGGWRVGDAIRAVDFLQTRPEVDPERIGIMGISGGGLTALWTAALDTRIRAAVVSGYFNTFRDSILSVDHCVDNYAPSLLNLMEMPDMAGLVAPRALFVESGAADSIFPLPAFERAVARAREIYSAFGVPERFGAETFPGDHHFHGQQALPFLIDRLV